MASNIDDLVRQSRYIIRGTIQKLNAATMSAISDTTNTVVARVDEVLQAPKGLDDFTGRDITIQLSQSRGVKVGQQAVFFTNSWLYGESIAVLEVGRVAAGKDLTVLRKQIADADQKIADQALQTRIDRAELIIVGKVAETRPVQKEGQHGPMTEHDPDWWEAVIGIESVEKGQFPEMSVIVLFPHSTDEMWIDSPKFHVNQEGIWILQRDQKEKGFPVLRIPGYTALDPLDFQPKDQLEGIRMLIKGSR